VVKALFALDFRLVDFGDDPTVVYDGDVVAEQLKFDKIGRDDNDCRSRLRNAAYDAVDLVTGTYVDADSGLIQQ
jgi:hypothetical protein